MSITLDGVTQNATVTGGTFSANFDTSALHGRRLTLHDHLQLRGRRQPPGTSDTSQALTVTKLSIPAFSGLSGPTIAYGTATTTLSGSIPLVPDGETCDFAGRRNTAATVIGGTFSSTFDATGLDVPDSALHGYVRLSGRHEPLPAERFDAKRDSDAIHARVYRTEQPDDHRGAASTTLSGDISLVPNGETVSITLNGVTQTATVTGGAFSSSFNTSALTAAGSPYTITYAYAGDANLAAVTDAGPGPDGDQPGDTRLQQPERAVDHLWHAHNDLVGLDFACPQWRVGVDHAQRRHADGHGLPRDVPSTLIPPR